jgi:hypothetical protein
MTGDMYRKPFEDDNGLYVYVSNEHDLFQMQWQYSIEWPQSGKPTIRIWSYTCWQRQTISAPLERVESLPFDIPMTERILYLLAEQAGKELYSRAVVLGSIKPVPENFLLRAKEAAAKGYDLKPLRELSQREAAASAGEAASRPLPQRGRSPVRYRHGPPDRGNPATIAGARHQLS